MERIHNIRIQKGMTQEQLAHLVGIKQPTLSSIESGKKSPSLDTATKIANALGCTVDDLLDKQDAV